MIPDIEYKVLVKCMTYNQSQYIEDAMNGFTMQRTDFPFVCLIMDDASTDGEQDVIKSYLEKHFDMASAEYSEVPEANVVVVPHKTNPNCAFAVYFLKENHYSRNQDKVHLYGKIKKKCKYIAICEGDDCWIDPNKLSKQVDYLENHDDVVLCYHNAIELNVRTNTYTYLDTDSNVPPISDITLLAKGNYISTLTVVFRNVENIDTVLSSMGNLPMSDYITWVLLAQHGKMFRFPERMALYRSGIGVWSSLKTSVEKDSRMIIVLSKLFCNVDSTEIKQLLDNQIIKYFNRVNNDYHRVITSRRYRLGTIILSPLSLMKKIWNRFLQK